MQGIAARKALVPGVCDQAEALSAWSFALATPPALSYSHVQSFGPANGSAGLHAKEPKTMNKAIRNKLSVMMFLEYVIWGAWLPLLGLYLGPGYLNFDGSFQIPSIFNAFAIAAMIGMFFGGQMADRYFSQ